VKRATPLFLFSLVATGLCAQESSPVALREAQSPPVNVRTEEVAAQAAPAPPIAAPPLGTPFVEQAYWAPVLAAPPAFELHGLFNLNCTNQYITIYGLNLEKQGVMVQPQLLLSTYLYAHRTSWISEVLLTGGAWSSWHSHRGGLNPGHTREVDAYGGLTFTAARDWKLSVFYSSYLSQTRSFPTAWDLAFSLSLDDSRWLKLYALHPFVELRRQTEGRISLGFSGEQPGLSQMFKCGIAPAHLFRNGLKLELPVFAAMVPNGFYQHSDGTSAEGGLAFASSALKVSIPVRVLSTAHSTSSVYAATQYYRMVNAGLLDTNQLLGNSTHRERNLLQFHVGMTVAF
jgi:hypothetical protein